MSRGLELHDPGDISPAKSCVLQPERNVCTGVGCPAVNVISPLVMNHMFGEKEIGRFIAYLNIFIAFGVAFGSSIVGLIYDLTGSYTPAFLLMAALLFISVIIRGIFCSKKFYYKNRISPEELHEKIS